MGEKFRNKYRVTTTRLQTWDYSWPGAYFVTILTKNRKHYFGEIDNGKMTFTEIGQLANDLWYDILNHAKNIELGPFVIMPNHIHGIIILRGQPLPPAKARPALPPHPPVPWDRGDHGDRGGQDHKDPDIPPPPFPIPPSRFQKPGKNSLSTIIGGYKSAITKHANRMGIEFAWHPLFHDHIIRNQKAFANISRYIANNPKNWGKEKFRGKGKTGRKNA